MRERIESLLAAWAHFSYRHAWSLLLGVALVVAALATQLPKLTLDTSTESFLHDDDPLRLAYDEFREQFGRDDQVLFAIEAPNVYTPGFLDRLRSMHEDIENEVPSLEEVSSLINARSTVGEADRLIVGELLDERPESPEQWAEVERLARNNPMYENLLVSKDGHYATILVRTSAYSALSDPDDALSGFGDDVRERDVHRPFLTGEENSAIVAALERIRERYDAEGFRVYLAGAPVMTEAMQIAMTADMLRFGTLSLLVISGFLVLLFRKVSGVVLPMVTVILSVTAMLSVMALFGVPITLPTQILPTFLLSVGVGYAVHLLAIYYQQRREGADGEHAMAYSLRHSGLAIIMTGLTTAGGLVSFAAADLAPIADFGVFAPVGVLIALFFTLFALPAATAVFPMGAESQSGGRSGDRISQRLLVQAGEFANTHAWSITLSTAGLLAIALLGALQLTFDHDPIEWFPEDNIFRISNQVVNDELKGAMFMEVLVDTGEENGLHDPALLGKLEELRRHAAAYGVGNLAVGKVISIVDVVKETNKALNENRHEFYAIPDDRLLVAQELLLFENSGSDDLEELVDSRFSQARMTLKVSMTGAAEYLTLIDHMQAKFGEVLEGSADFSFTGIMVVMGGTIDAVTRSMAKTYVVALAIITPLLVLLIGQVRLGLLAMVPNLTPIIFTLGIMGWAGIPLDTFTLLVGSIAIGLAVDDTIHFMHQFRRSFEVSGDVASAIRETLRSTGQALLYTSLVLSAGFFIYTFAMMENLFFFGFLTGLTIIFAFLADLLLAPALITLAARPVSAPDTECESNLEATT